MVRSEGSPGAWSQGTDASREAPTVGGAPKGEGRERSSRRIERDEGAAEGYRRPGRAAARCEGLGEIAGPRLLGRVPEAGTPTAHHVPPRHRRVLLIWSCFARIGRSAADWLGPTTAPRRRPPSGWR